MHRSPSTTAEDFGGKEVIFLLDIIYTARCNRHSKSLQMVWGSKYIEFLLDIVLSSLQLAQLFPVDSMGANMLNFF